uniref:interleukin-17 receptor B isoform X2 n=2 Tax=Scatophagus argus TaxID=75038 RepID=UPI001ED7DDC7|nr:interleukin-17 receptor B isoform X2 [Scatophagus argus]
MRVSKMRGVTLILVSYAVTQVTSHEIKVECHELDDFPPDDNTSPSVLADLTVGLVTVGDRYSLNISWAINIDASIEHLTSTLIMIWGESMHYCEYNPRLALANLTGTNQKWFHYLVDVNYGSTTVQAANLPLPRPGMGHPYKYTEIDVPRTKSTVMPTARQIPVVETSTLDIIEQDSRTEAAYVAEALFGGLGSLMILSSCYIIYKRCRPNFVTSSGFKMLNTSPMVPVPVLLVYPAENSAFQQAMVALAEFLQWHGGCSVVVDMWQQGKIAEQGPMRWLAEQVKAAKRVLIVCPQLETASSNPSIHPEPSIPAAAHDLYPLILNMVASHAKSPSDLAKFWVVQLGEQPNNLAPELRACKTFFLMKDLIKLCRSLHSQRQIGGKISDLIFSPGIEKSAVNLREAVEKLDGHRPSQVSKVEALKSVVTTI